MRTVQLALNQRCLPLRCVVCRTKILKLKRTCDVRPFTPPPPQSSSSSSSLSRHNVTLPWHRQRSLSPCPQRTPGHDDVRKRSVRSSKYGSTRARKALLVYPEFHQPRRAFGSSSTYEKLHEYSDDDTATSFSNRKQVRFASAIQHHQNEAPLPMSDSDKEGLLCKSPSYGKTYNRSNAVDPNQEVTSAQKSILRKNVISPVPSVCDSIIENDSERKETFNHTVFPRRYLSGQNDLFR